MFENFVSLLEGQSNDMGPYGDMYRGKLDRDYIDGNVYRGVSDRGDILDHLGGIGGIAGIAGLDNRLPLDHLGSMGGIGGIAGLDGRLPIGFDRRTVGQLDLDDRYADEDSMRNHFRGGMNDNENYYHQAKS